MKLPIIVKRYAVRCLLLMCAIICVLGLFSCKSNCNHVYSIHKTVEATCTEEGYNEYKCSECGDKHKETISAKGHTAGEAPTLDTLRIVVYMECNNNYNPTLRYNS